MQSSQVPYPPVTVLISSRDKVSKKFMNFFFIIVKIKLISYSIKDFSETAYVGMSKVALALSFALLSI
jgi:hypothetical protein